METSLKERNQNQEAALVQARGSNGNMHAGTIHFQVEVQEMKVDVLRGENQLQAFSRTKGRREGGEPSRVSL